MKNVKEKKEIAQALYYQRQTMKDIAEKLNVSERTVHSWAKKDNWKERRAAQNISKNAIEKTDKKSNLINYLQNLITIYGVIFFIHFLFYSPPPKHDTF